MSDYPYSYVCLRCGRKLIPEGETSNTTASILFDLCEALHIHQKNDRNRFLPVYFTKQELSEIVENPQSTGDDFMNITVTFETFIRVISNRLHIREDKRITATEMKYYIQNEYRVSGDTEDDWVIRKVRNYINLCLPDDLVGGLDNATAAHFRDIVSSLFFDDAMNVIPYEFRIQVNLAAIGKAGTRLMYQYMSKDAEEGGEKMTPSVPVICGEERCWHRRGRCGAVVPPMAWQHEHIAVGFIGAAHAGKTCLITALLHRLLNSNGSELIPNDRDDEIRGCLQSYQRNQELPKTAADGHNSFNATILYQDKLLSLADIAGECFDLDLGRFNRDMANQYFQMISICRCYVLCLDPMNDVYVNTVLAAQSISEFAEFLKAEGQKYVVPFLLAMTKCDSKADLLMQNFDDILLNGDESQENRIHQEEKFADYLRESKKIIRANYPNFYNNLSKKTYIACSVVSAYGCRPCPCEQNQLSIAKAKSFYPDMDLYLTKDGQYYFSKYPMTDFRVPKESLHTKQYVRQIENGQPTYYFNPGQMTQTEENTYSMKDIRLLPNKTDNKSRNGVIFDKDGFASKPIPYNTQGMTEWILRVCGITPIKYIDPNQEEEETYLLDYTLKKNDRWLYGINQLHSNQLILCIRNLFVNPTDMDIWADEYEGRILPKLLMCLFIRTGNQNRIRWLINKLQMDGEPND